MSTLARAPSLVDQFERGLDAPICLTWELTYACNLACVHCLSSSGRRDPRELSTDECKRGDRRARSACRSSTSTSAAASRRCGRDFWELRRLRHRAPRRREVLHQRQPHHAERAARLAASDYVDVQISLDGATRRRQRRASAARARTRPRCARWSTCAAAGFGGFKISVVVTRAERRPARRVQGDRRRVRRPAADHAAAPVRPRRRRLGRAAPDGRAAARALRLAGRARRGRADGRLVLPPVGVRRVAAGAEPVRRRARRLPDRPGRRRLRVPVRDP